jgi:PS-10 peptidase S37
VRMARILMLPMLVLLPAASPVAADDIVDRLEAIPGFTVVEERPHPLPGHRLFVLSYSQRVNHLKPWKGTFEQRVALIHRSEDAPTVLVTDGYNTSFSPSRAQVTQIVDGNQVRVEHRFFEPSRPEPADWRDLTIFQAATDHHRIVSALRSIYSGRWLATGASKSGMAAVYFRRFYPDDVHATIAYVAPNDVIDHRDRYIEFLDDVGTDPACRAGLAEMQRQTLLRRNEIVSMMLDQAEDQGVTYEHVLGSPDRALEVIVLETPFLFWQYAGQEFCPVVPAPDASTEEIFLFIDTFAGFASYSDQVLDFFAPYFYQAATQLGYPTVADDHLADLLLFPGADVAESFVPPEIDIPRFQPWTMIDIDLHVRLFGRRLMFIYGEVDPWGAEPFRLGPGTRDSYAYVVPGGTHGAHIGLLPPDQSSEAVSTILRWADVPESAAVRKPTPLGAELETEELDLRPRL